MCNSPHWYSISHRQYQEGRTKDYDEYMRLPHKGSTQDLFNGAFALMPGGWLSKSWSLFASL